MHVILVVLHRCAQVVTQRQISVSWKVQTVSQYLDIMKATPQLPLLAAVDVQGARNCLTVKSANLGIYSTTPPMSFLTISHADHVPSTA